MLPYIIGIAGESGVGKSTIAEIISFFYGIDNTIIISTDDLHKWERGNSAWEHITHLNPDANNLELGDIHLSELSQGKSIYRSIYNHKTGFFDPPKKIEPKKIVIIEGLHSFYTEIGKELIDLKIYIDTDEELKTHWKIIRDTEERGYKYNMVLDAIAARRPDAKKIRQEQIGVADSVITMNSAERIGILGDKHENIDLVVSINSSNTEHTDLLSFIQEFILASKNYNKMSKIGGNVELCQDFGGNVSVKLTNDIMLIKSSGTKISDDKYSIVSGRGFVDNVINDRTFDLALVNLPVSSNQKRPSMEAGFHLLLDKYVIHIHPIYLTLLLCLNNSKDIIDELYNNISFQYVEYVNPGYDLYKQIKSLPICNIYFLENHGLIVSSSGMNECLEMMYNITDKAKTYLKNHPQFVEFDISFGNYENFGFAFPDAFIFANDPNKIDTIAVNNYISTFGSKIDAVRYLPLDILQDLKNSNAEKYRKNQK